MANKIAHEVRNKYTVHGKLAALQSAVEQLEAAQLRIKAELLTELQQYLDANCHGMNGKDGVDGKDCQCRELKGDKGDPGSVLFIGESEAVEAVKQVRAELLRFRAAVLGRIIQHIEDHDHDRGHSRLVRMHLTQLKKDIEKL